MEATTILALSLLTGADAAIPKPFYPPAPVAGWVVLGLGNSCVAQRDFPGGARLSFNMGSDWILYLIVRNQRWQGIKNSEQYALAVNYDGKTTTESATGFRDKVEAAPEIGFEFLSDDAHQFLRTSRRMTLSLDNRVLGSFPLDGVPDALRALGECVERAPRQSPPAK